MAKQVAVIGLGRFGTSIAQELYRIGHDVLAIDVDERVTQTLIGQVTYAVTGDATSAELIEELGIKSFDTAVVAIGTDVQSSILATVLLKQQYQLPQVVARATTELHARTLIAVGADRVIHPEQEAGIRTAHSLFQREVLEYMELTSDYGFSKISASPDMEGQSLEAAGFSTARDKYGAAVIAIKRGREPILAPSKDEQIKQGDVLVVAGREEVLERVRPS